MSLTSGEVAALAGQATGFVPATTDVHIAPHTDDDPYRWGSASWQVRFVPEGGGSVSLVVSADGSAAEALARMLDQLSEYGPEQGALWGQAIPACPGHRHAARVEVDGGEVVLVCPDTQEPMLRVQPVGAEPPSR